MVYELGIPLKRVLDGLEDGRTIAEIDTDYRAALFRRLHSVPTIRKQRIELLTSTNHRGSVQLPLWKPSQFKMQNRSAEGRHYWP